MSIPKAAQQANLGPRVKASALPRRSATEAFTATNEELTKLTVQMERSLHRRFKSAVIEEDVTMREVIEQKITEWLQERGRS